MTELFQHYIPVRGFMDQKMVFGQHARMEISRKTPVIDHLEGFDAFYEALVKDILTHDTTDIIAIGKSGTGKGAIIEQTLRKIEDDRRLKGRRGKGKVAKQYYSLAAEFQDAVTELGVVSPWGEFTPEELAEGAQKAAELGREKLDRAEREAPKPLVRGLEFVAVASPIDLGSSLVVQAVQRAQEDPTYTYRIIATKTDPTVQGNSLQTRQALWNLPQDAPSSEVNNILRRSKVKADTHDLDVTRVRTSAGHPIALQLVNQLIHEQIVARQDEIRAIDSTFPHFDTPSDVERDAATLHAAENGYYRLLLFHDFGADPNKTLLVTNTFLDRQIPFYTRRTGEYRIR